MLLKTTIRILRLLCKMFAIAQDVARTMRVSRTPALLVCAICPISRSHVPLLRRCRWIAPSQKCCGASGTWLSPRRGVTALHSQHAITDNSCTDSHTSSL